MAIFLEGEGLRIRNSKAADQSIVESLLAATDCSLMALGQHPEQLHVFNEREEYFPESVEENKVYRFMVEDQNALAIGYVGVKVTNIKYRRVELSYFIADEFKGHGYATSALKLITNYVLGAMEMKRAFVKIAEENIPSLRVAEKAGFQKEGLMKDYKQIGSKWHNYWLLAKTS